MATLTVLKFATAGGAGKLAEALPDLQKQRLIAIQDAAIVAWEKGATKPKTTQLASTTVSGALDGSFWGMLFGLIFFVPLLGFAIGAASGALLGHFTDIGIDDGFIKDTQGKITEGTSALFLLSSDAVPDRLAEELKQRGLSFEIIASNLSHAQEERLREVFAS